MELTQGKVAVVTGAASGIGLALAERFARAGLDDSFGKSPDELRRVLDDISTTEPLLRRAADHEVRTTMPLTEVVTTILRLVSA
jgi:NAD(P)-dependent dehydrogenase (short-subunit alcohol dehydrogenase family)